MSTAVKLTDELVGSARIASALWHRSMTQQIEHWARIGRALEQMPGLALDKVERVLSADMSFDTLSPEEQAMVLGKLEGMLVKPEGDSQLHRQMRRKGTPYTVLDPDGRLVEVLPDGQRHEISDADDYAGQMRKASD